MAEEDRGKASVIPIRAGESENRNLVKSVYQGAADELIEDAIEMLSLLEELKRDNEPQEDKPRTILCSTVAVQARQIITVLRKAQQHHREMLKL